MNLFPKSAFAKSDPTPVFSWAIKEGIIKVLPADEKTEKDRSEEKNK